MRTSFYGVVGEITSLPGCSQIAVSHDVFLPEKDRNKGLGSAANLARKRYAFTTLGYDMMICTVSSDNHSQLRILRECGWTYLKSFNSRKTGHRVQLWCCERIDTQ